MYIRTRALGSAVVAAALLVSLAGVTRAGGEAGGDITFRLTLRGDVVEGDGFTLGIMATDNPTIISPGFLCGPGVLEPRAPLPCEPGSYEFVVEGRDVLPVGTELTYVFARITPEGENIRIYSDAVTITEHDQNVSVVYDYDLGQETGRDAEARGGTQLPDTATGLPADVVPLGIAALVGSVAVGVYVHNRSRRLRSHV